MMWSQNGVLAAPGSLKEQGTDFPLEPLRECGRTKSQRGTSGGDFFFFIATRMFRDTRFVVISYGGHRKHTGQQ